ncbi:MAG TPA: DUF6600 domain-containing protein [Vicinamibacterales bacterium]|nr:DUF6600 domain-containing protein [Vicinamibacterales bacterium]
MILAPLQAQTQNPYDSVRQEISDPPEAPDAWADDDIPAHVSVVDGNATLERDGRIEVALENTLLLAGDRLRTDRGRVSILYADGSSLDIDQFSSVDLLSESLLRLNSGRIRLAVVRVTLAQPLRVDGAGATAWIQQPGEYRVSLGDPRATTVELTLATLRGSAELVSSAGRTLLRGGTAAATTANTAPTAPWTINVSATDEFDRWSEEQRNARSGSQSIPYIPSELSAYSGTLDTSGSWEYQETYGYVWYPSVGVGWWPYCDGRWSFVGGFGWTWAGGPRWAYPTHHYGRWGNNSNRWYWIPDRRWSPAWVSWAHAPGYVGWSPLGFDNRPVHGFASDRGNPNWGWTILPSRSFASRVNVRDYAVTADRVPDSTWSEFARRGAPTRPSVISVNETPLRAPGVPSRGRAIPRGTIATPIAIGAARAITGTASRSGAAAPRSSGRTVVPRTGGAAPAGYTVGPSASPYSSIPAPTATSDNRARIAPGYAVTTGTSGNGAATPQGTTGRVERYPAARPGYPPPSDAASRGVAVPRNPVGAPSAAAPSSRSAAPLPIMMRGTPPSRPAEAPSEIGAGNFGGSGRTGPVAGSGAPPAGYGSPAARPRGGDSPSAAPTRDGAPASAGPSPRGGPSTAAPIRGGLAPTGRIQVGGRGGR